MIGTRGKRVLSTVVSLAGLMSAAGLRAEKAICNTYERIAYSDVSTNCVLDLSMPDSRGYATIVWLHGGGLQKGHRHHLVGLDRTKYASAAVEYRLVPEGTYTNCVEDAAAAVAWTLEHIAEYGGDPKKVFLGGHSAGGWLTYMVGMDPRWLKTHGHAPSDLAGLLPISGQATKATLKNKVYTYACSITTRRNLANPRFAAAGI